MPIGNTKIDVNLRRVRLLSDAAAWFDMFRNDNAIKNEIVRLIKEEQLTKKGVDGNNQVIGYYSAMTSLINKKKKFNAPYDLNDTGKFYESIYVYATMDAIVTFGKREFPDGSDIFEKYGDDIIKLTDENFEKIKGMVRDAYIRYARKILFGDR